MCHIQVQSLKSLCLTVRRRCFYKKIHYLTFDLSQGHTKCCPVPLPYVTYPSTKFEVATSKGLVEDTFTRNVTDARTHGPTLIYPFFLKKNAGSTIKFV